MIRICFLAILTILVIGCGIDLDPCTYEVGDTFKVKIYDRGYINRITYHHKGCDTPVILQIVNKNIFWREVGDTLKLVVTKRIDEHYYHVRVTK